MKTFKRSDKKVSFYENNTYLGTIDYKDHSDWYINKAIENWKEDILTKDVIDRFKE